MTSNELSSELSPDANWGPGYRHEIQFLRNGRLVTVTGFPPSTTVLDYLRESSRETGTKEGCGEGDCGACTVVIGAVKNGRIQYRAVNACILLLGSLDGKHLITVEDLAQGGELHPVQQALVKHHGSQCGFCTPGFVMALFALAHQTDRPPLTRQKITDAIAGNLCRCTGYRSIVDAAFEACENSLPDFLDQRREEYVSLLSSISATEHVIIGDRSRLFAAPANEDELASLYQRFPSATLVSGATDVGLWITKQMRDIEQVIHLGRVSDFDRCVESEAEVTIGAGCSYADAHAVLTNLDPDIGELVRRIGSDQIRNAGTVGGNIANGSPIGDMPPVLIALGAEIELRAGDRIRTLKLEDFFIDYGVQNRSEGEFIRLVRIAKPAEDSVFRCYKIAKRFDQDISSVLGAFHFRIADRVIRDARIAYGGMAATPRRAVACERALADVALDDPATWQTAMDAIGKDFEPLTDHRASSAYRMRVAQSLLEKALIEIADENSATRLIGLREVVNV